MIHQQRIGSLEPWKQQGSFDNLLPNMESNPRPRLTSGPSAKKRAQPETTHVLGVHQSSQIVHNGWWYKTVPRTTGNHSNRSHKKPTRGLASASFVSRFRLSRAITDSLSLGLSSFLLI